MSLINNRITVLIFILLCLLQLPFTYFAQQEKRSKQPQLTRDKSLFPLQSTGIWTELHPLIPRVDYWGVDFVNADTGWAAGEGGAIIRTTNGGDKWVWFESGVENTLRTIAVVNNGQRLIAGGDGGIIIISEDGGENWDTLPSGTIENIWNLQMITEEIGWMVGEGGTALKTTDGGLTWIQQPMPYPTAPYWDASFIDTSFGYVCSAAGIVLKTTNGGGDWQIQQAGDTRALWTIYALDKLRASGGGFAGKVVYTTDGGNNWLYAGGNPSVVNKIKFINDTTGFIAGSFYKTTDGGVIWFPLDDLNEKGNHPGTTNLAFPDRTDGYITGVEMLLAKTTDKGESWRRTIVNAGLISADFKDEYIGFMNSSHFIYRTDDGGNTLDTLETFPYSLRALTHMVFLDSLTGFVGMQSMKIYKSIDGGVNWYDTVISGLVDTLGSIQKLFFYDRMLGWAVSTRGYILGTTDGGEIWVVQLNLGISRSFYSVHFYDSLNGWANSRYVWQTTDGGNNWIERTDIPAFISNDVYFQNDLSGYITENNNLFRTTDSGFSWNLDTLASGFGQGRFAYFDSNNFFITGSKVYRTTDGGYSWTDFPELEGLDWRYRLSLINVNSGFLVGEMGLVVKYFDDSVTFISPEGECEYTDDFYIFQNYPNPFNPTTKIKYAIPQTDNPLLGGARGGWVTLKVYDVLGREIATLVNGEKPTGEYVVNFNASGLPSGIYFYQLKTESFIETKKMILMK